VQSCDNSTSARAAEEAVEGSGGLRSASRAPLKRTSTRRTPREVFSLLSEMVPKFPVPRTRRLLLVLAFTTGCGARSSMDLLDPYPSAGGPSCGTGTTPAGDGCVPIPVPLDGGASGTDASAVGVVDASDADLSTVDASGQVGVADASGGLDGGGIDYGIDAGIDISTACLGNQNTLVVAGDGFLQSGPPSVWTWQGSGSIGSGGGPGWVPQGSVLNWTPDGRPTRLHILWFPPGMGSPQNWTTVFSTDVFWARTSLSPGVYASALFDDPGNSNTIPISEEGHPGLDVEREGPQPARCPGLTGEFRILEITWDISQAFDVTSLIATFKVTCGSTGTNVGCLHFIY
jgi:hypothetical protein